jgi:hypothetical protein
LIKLVFAFLIPQTLKKGQKKSKNKFDQEETTDAWGFEKPSTSGIPQKTCFCFSFALSLVFVVFQRC